MYLYQPLTPIPIWGVLYIYIYIHMIYIYIYTSVNPCISMHGAKKSRAMFNRVKCHRAQLL